MNILVHNLYLGPVTGHIKSRSILDSVEARSATVNTYLHFTFRFPHTRLMMMKPGSLKPCWAGHTSLSSPILHALTSRGAFQSTAPSRGEMRVKWSQLDITCFLIFKNKKHFPEAATVMLARWLLVSQGRGVTLGLLKHITLWHRLWLLKAHTEITKTTTFSQRHWHSDPS